MAQKTYVRAIVMVENFHFHILMAVAIGLFMCVLVLLRLVSLTSISPLLHFRYLAEILKRSWLRSAGWVKKNAETRWFACPLPWIQESHIQKQKHNDFLNVIIRISFDSDNVLI